MFYNIKKRLHGNLEISYFAGVKINNLKIDKNEKDYV
jgi:hypothetical protein